MTDRSGPPSPQELLLRALSGRLAAADVPPALADRLWADMDALAGEYQLRPMLYGRTRDLPDGVRPPAEVERRLLDAYRLTTAANLRHFHHAGRIVGALRRHDIDAIVLKGTYLAQAVYASPGLRPMRDIDLLLREHELSRALRTLADEGYSPVGTDADPDEQDDTAAHVAPMVKPGSPAIEVHRAIEGRHSPFTIDMDGLWSRARRTKIKMAGVEVLVMAHEDFLLHLCLHATRHLTRDWRDRTVLKGLCDITEAVRQWGPELDWDAFCRRVGQWRARNPAAVMLHLAHDWLGAAVPARVLETLAADGLPRELLECARGRILSPAQVAPDDIADGVARFAAAKGWRAKFAVACRQTFPAPHDLARLYHVSPTSPALPLCYGRRLAHLLGRLPATTWQLVRHRRRLAVPLKLAGDTVSLQRWLQSPNPS